MWCIGFVAIAFLSGSSAYRSLGPVKANTLPKCGVQKASVPEVGTVPGSVLPWVGLVYAESKDGATSSNVIGMGVLLDKQHVLTIDYIGQPWNKEKLKFIRFGASRIDNDTEVLDFSIDKVFVHSSGDEPGTLRHKGKISIIKLKDPVTFNDFVSPVCLPEKGVDYTSDKYYLVTYNREYTNQNSNTRSVTLLPKKETGSCFVGSEADNFSPEAYICAGDKTADACNGDGGSPLLVQKRAVWYATALTDFGPGECKGGSPSAFLKIEPFVDWINSIIA